MATILKKWSDDQIQRVWEKGTIIPGVDEKIYRQDTAGAWIKRSEYGNIKDETNLGWEIDHLKPKSKQGTDDISNLRPFQWNNNRTKGDDYPNWCTSITHDNGQYIKNIKKIVHWTISK